MATEVAAKSSRLVRILRRVLFALGSVALITALAFVLNGTSDAWRTPESGFVAVLEPRTARRELRVMAFNAAKCGFFAGGRFVEREVVTKELDTIAQAIVREDCDLVVLSEVVLECGPEPLDQVVYLAQHAGLPHFAASENYSFGVPFFPRPVGQRVALALAAEGPGDSATRRRSPVLESHEQPARALVRSRVPERPAGGRRAAQRLVRPREQPRADARDPRLAWASPRAARRRLQRRTARPVARAPARERPFQRPRRRPRRPSPPARRAAASTTCSRLPRGHFSSTTPSRSARPTTSRSSRRSPSRKPRPGTYPSSHRSCLWPSQRGCEPDPRF
jgi:hypothetical protein